MAEVAPPSGGRSPSRRRRRLTLGLLLGAFFGTMAARLVVSPLVPDLLVAFDVSKGAIGLALSGMWAAYAVTQFPAGVAADRFGERPLVLAGLAVTAVASLLVALAPSYPAFAVAAGAVGVGAGLYFPAAASLLTRLFENTGQVLGLHISGGDSAGLVIPVVATAVAARVGWRAALAVAPAVVAAMFVLSAWRLPGDGEAAQSRRRSPVDLRTPLRLLSTPTLLFTTALSVLLAFTFQAVISFFPTFLVEYWGVTVGRAGLYFAVVFLLWIVFSPVGGRLADAVGEDGVLAAMAVCMTAGVAVLLAAPTFPVAVVGVVLLGVGMSWGGVIAARFMVALPAADRTTGYGLVRSVYMLLGAAGSVVTGTLAEVSGWPAAYGLLVVLLSAVALALLANRALDLGL